MSLYSSEFTFFNGKKKKPLKIDEIIEKGLLDDNNETIFIPRSVNIESKNMIIKKVSFWSEILSIKSIIFSDDSELSSLIIETSIYNSIENISIPASLKEFKIGLYHWYIYLKKITVSPKNKNFIFINDQYLLGKSNNSGNEYDVLIFSRRDIENAIIPSYIKVIGPSSFAQCTKLKSIKFEQNSKLESIEKNAFYNCKSLIKISIPDSLRCIKEEAFQLCTNLIEIEISDKSELLQIAKSVFNSTKIETLYIPPHFDKFDNKSLQDMVHLKTISVAPSNKNFKFIHGNYLVYNLISIIFSITNIEEIFIPSFIKYISKGAFKNCKNLKSVIFEENSNLISIENEAFYECTSLKVFSIPKSVEYIHEKAFYNCDNLIEFNIEDDSSLLYIGPFVFGFTKIQHLNVPSKFEGFDEESLIEMNHLMNISISPLNKRFKNIENKYIIYKTKAETETENDQYDSLIFCSRDIEEAFIPPEITKISSFAFGNCSKLKTVILHPQSQLSTIMEHAFDKCDNLECITFKINNDEKLLNCCDNLKSYINCTSPTNSDFIPLQNDSLNISGSSKSIQPSVFYYSFSLELITIPSSVERIERFTFEHCINLKSVNFLENSRLKIIEHRAFAECSSLEQIMIPLSLQFIKNSAFCSCHNLKKLIFNENSKLIYIEKYAFNNCSSLEQVLIPDSVLFIEEYAFNSCCNLKLVEISNNSKLISIGDYAFNNTKIDRIYIPSKVKKIGFLAFKSIIHIHNISISPLNTNYSIIDGQYFVTKTNAKKDEFDYLIYSDKDIEEANIPSYIKKIGSHAFYECSKLKKVIIPEDSKLQSIGEFSFYNTMIDEIYIPSRVNEIGHGCFQKASQLKNIIISNENKNFKYLDNKLLIGKIDGNSKQCDNILFARLDIDDAEIPSFIKKIDDYSFNDCSYLKKISFVANSQIKKLGENAFYNCSSLTEIYIPSSLKIIDRSCFSYCSNLEKIDFGNGSHLLCIRSYAFSNCYSLKIRNNRRKCIFKYKTRNNHNSFKCFNN